MHTPKETDTTPPAGGTFQTFVPKSDNYPIALSILWRPIPDLTGETANVATTSISMFVLHEPRIIADNPGGAIITFLKETVRRDRERQVHIITDLMSLDFRRPKEVDMQIDLYQSILQDLSDEEIDTIAKRHCDHIMGFPIVVGNVQPTQRVLGKLLSMGTIGVGAHVSLSIGSPEPGPFVAVSCVAGGVLVMGTAAGVGRALQSGLSESLDGLINGGSKKSEHGT